MRRTIRWIAALALPVLLLTGSLVEAQKKPNAEKDLDKSTEKMVKAGMVNGKIMAVYEDKKKIRIQVSYPTIDPEGVKRLYNARAAIAQARDANAMRSAQNSLAEAQRTMYKYENKDIEIQAADDVVVRMLRPKEDFDDNQRDPLPG